VMAILRDDGGDDARGLAIDGKRRARREAFLLGEFKVEFKLRRTAGQNTAKPQDGDESHD
jgi:hypothetical protein